jgi:hypothetical protein
MTRAEKLGAALLAQCFYWNADARRDDSTGALTNACCPFCTCRLRGECTKAADAGSVWAMVRPPMHIPAPAECPDMLYKATLGRWNVTCPLCARTLRIRRCTRFQTDGGKRKAPAATPTPLPIPPSGAHVVKYGGSRLAARKSRPATQLLGLLPSVRDDTPPPMYGGTPPPGVPFESLSEPPVMPLVVQPLCTALPAQAFDAASFFAAC